MNRKELNSYYLAKIDEALKKGDVNDILDKINAYYKGWQNNKAENEFYFSRDYKDVSQLLSEIAKSGFLTNILSQGSLYKMLPKNELASIAIENQDTISQENFDKFQDYILETCDAIDCVKIAGIYRANFSKIQDRVFSSANTNAIAELVQIFPKKADVARAYERVKFLSEKKQNNNITSVKENFETVKKIYDERTKRTIKVQTPKTFGK